MKDAIRGPAAPPQVELLDELYGAEPAQLLQIIRLAEVTDPRTPDGDRPQSRHA